MKIKIMCPNDKGKIELTKEELEKLLNESYSEGYSDGYYGSYWISTTPHPFPYRDVLCTTNNNSIARSVSNKTEPIEINSINGLIMVKTNEI